MDITYDVYDRSQLLGRYHLDVTREGALDPDIAQRALDVHKRAGGATAATLDVDMTSALFARGDDWEFIARGFAGASVWEDVQLRVRLIDDPGEEEIAYSWVVYDTQEDETIEVIYGADEVSPERFVERLETTARRRATGRMEL